MSATTIFVAQRAKPRLRRERFVQEYLADPQRNATAAYLRAGYKASPVSARAAAARLLRHRDVRRAIEAARDADAGNYEVQRERVVEQLARIAFSDVRELFHADGTLKEISELDAGTAAALAHYEVHETYLACQSGSIRETESGTDIEPPRDCRRP
jgi:phage terminase small subunit